MPFAVRVDAALARLLGSRPWTPPQRDWLVKLATQLRANDVVDPELLNSPTSPVQQQIGGFDRLNASVFKGELTHILARLQDDVWLHQA